MSIAPISDIYLDFEPDDPGHVVCGTCSLAPGGLQAVALVWGRKRGPLAPSEARKLADALLRCADAVDEHNKEAK